ncbi:MAG: transposase [Anaerolineales bacterium]|nr:MAG: transposase [Anaerolineales bacterium]
MFKSVRQRKTLRLPNYDYSQPGAYFITACSYKHLAIFGKVVKDNVILSPAGFIVQDAWHDLPNLYLNIRLDSFIAMPTHIHSIIIITVSSTTNHVGAGLRPAPTDPIQINHATTTRHDLPEIIRALKSFSARRINKLGYTPGAMVWQRGYYEHVIRNERQLNSLRNYIETNSLRWKTYAENPAVQR